MVRKIPKKIDHEHIVDSVVELRFQPKDEKSVILDMMVAARDIIKDGHFMSAEIPRSLRITDPNLKFGVEATLKGQQFSIGFGSNSIVFNCQNGYKLWGDFYPFIVSVLDRVSPFIDKVSRIGVRFTNFFEGSNDLKPFNVAFKAGHGENAIQQTDVKQMVLKFSASEKAVSCNVTIANQARIPQKANPGTLVDVDAYVDKNLPDTMEGINKYIELAHDKEKEIFFSLLQNEFLQSLNPEY